MDIIKKLTEELGIKEWQTVKAVELIDEGNTIPLSRVTVRKLRAALTTYSSATFTKDLITSAASRSARRQSVQILRSRASSQMK